MFIDFAWKTGATLTISVAVALGAGCDAFCWAQANNKDKGAASESAPKKVAPKLTPTEKRFLKTVENKLHVRQNAAERKNNPGHRKTWYVLMFLDEASAASVTESSSSTSRSTTFQTQAARNGDAMLVQGKEEAAFTVSQFLFSANTAAAQLDAPPTGFVQQANVGGKKTWDFVAFTDEAEAKVLFAQVKPAKPKEGK